MRWIEILDDVPYWEFCLIYANMVVGNDFEDISLRA